MCHKIWSKFTKRRKKIKKTQEEKQLECFRQYLEESAISFGFNIEPPRKFRKTHTEEEIAQERERIAGEYLKILQELM